MPSQIEEKIPRVFISYSHDSPAHKKWVAELASKLVGNGIDVTLDQWDLGLGDDVPKFMEVAVTEADRVLVVCTETYVNKADAGKGGVGYESMIVTGELIKDLGSSKFIPVVKQSSKEPRLPKTLSTRFYINLSTDEDFKNQFELLLKELHQVPSAIKPPLGKNPFAKQPSGIEIPIGEGIAFQIPNIRSHKEDFRKIYNIAIETARQGDIVSWRKIVQQAKEPIKNSLHRWRERYEKSIPNSVEEMHEAALEGMHPYQTLIVIALAGVESGRAKFNNQVSLMDEILMPKNWSIGGDLRIADFPKSIAYVYQALHGATCLYTNQISLAISFARTKVSSYDERDSLPIYLNHEVVGWPDSLGRNSQEGYNFLVSLPDKWTWLNEIFGDKDEYRQALCAYYMALNILEFIEDLAKGKEQMIQSDQEIGLDVPLCFLSESREIKKRAYKLLISDREEVKSIWNNAKVKESTIQTFWPHWMKHTKYWLNRMHKFGLGTSIEHKNLIEII